MYAYHIYLYIIYIIHIFIFTSDQQDEHVEEGSFKMRLYAEVVSSPFRLLLPACSLVKPKILCMAGWSSVGSHRAAKIIQLAPNYAEAALKSPDGSQMV